MTPDDEAEPPLARQEADVPPAAAPAAGAEVGAEPTADAPDPLEQALRPRNRRELINEDLLYRKSEANLYGGITAGTVIINAGDRGEHLYRRGEPGEAFREFDLDESTLQRISAVFVPPRPYTRAYACLCDNGLVIVRGPAGCGKSAAAVFLAHEIRNQHGTEIRRLSADTDLHRWSGSHRVSPSTVYLIDGLLGTRAREMPDHLWRELAEELRAGRSYLVISASQYVTFGAVTQAYVQPWEPPDDSELVLARHLRLTIGDEARIKALLATEDVQKLLATRHPPQTLAWLANRLKEVDDGALSLAEALRVAAGSDEADVREWFDGARDDEERALWLALAVFNGSRFRLAQEAARLLTEQMREVFGQPATGAELPPAKSWYQPDDYWRSRAGVELRLEDYDGQSPLPVEVVRLRDSSLPQGILRYLWNDVPQFRPVLLAWLARLGAGEQSETRIRAALAAAALGQLDYETVLHSVLDRWARENTPRTRQSLANALRSLATSEQYAEATLLLLRGWAEKGDKAHVWAAARAYGLIGLYYPREAMDGWLGILSRYDYLQHYRLGPTLRLSIIDPDLRPLFDSLFEAIASFFVAALDQPRADFVHIYSQVVTALRIGLEEKGDGGLFTLTSLALFLALMGLRIGEDVLVERKPDAALDEAQASMPQGAPALLVLVHFLDPRSPALDDLTWMLGLAIRTQATRKAAVHGALHDWLIYLQATHDDQLYTAQRRVLQSLVRQPSFGHRWRREVGRPFEQWAARKSSAHRPMETKTPPPPLSLAGRLVGEVVELQG